MLGPRDQMLEFGTLDLASASAATYFPNVIKVADGDFTQCACDFSVSGAEGGTSVTFAIAGSDDGDDWTELAATGAIPLSDLDKSITLNFPRHRKYAFYKAQLKAKAGSFTAGKILAAVDPYVGK